MKIAHLPPPDEPDGPPSPQPSPSLEVNCGSVSQTPMSQDSLSDREHSEVEADSVSDAPSSFLANGQVHAENRPVLFEPPPVGPAEAAVRKHMVDQALISESLVCAIEVSLRCRRRSYRWSELIAEAVEIRQEVALRALDRLGTFDHHTTLALPWLMGIAMNIIRERGRWDDRESAHTRPQSSCTEEEWNGILSQLRVEPKHSDEPHPVWQALARMDSDPQRIIRLRYVNERSYAAIAETFGISEDAARARLCRALQALRRLTKNTL